MAGANARITTVRRRPALPAPIQRARDVHAVPPTLFELAALAVEREPEPISFLDETRGRHTLIANQPCMTLSGINRRAIL